MTLLRPRRNALLAVLAGLPVLALAAALFVRQARHSAALADPVARLRAHYIAKQQEDPNYSLRFAD